MAENALSRYALPQQQGQNRLGQLPDLTEQDYIDSPLGHLSAGQSSFQGQEVRPFNPTWRDRLAVGLLNHLSGDARPSVPTNRLVEGLLGSRGLGTTGLGLIDATPAGIPLAVQEVNRNENSRTGDVGLAIFGGVGARTANRTALKTAQSLQKSGVSREKIWKDTGWFQGSDKKWRFEIDDRGINVTDGKGHLGTPGAPIQHNRLLEAYPQLSKVRASVNSGGDGTSYNPLFRKLTVNNRGGTEQSVALHELQHAVQKIEDFEPGGNRNTVSLPSRSITDAEVSQARLDADDFRQYASEAGSRKTADMYNWMAKDFAKTASQGRLSKKAASMRAYHRLSGEVEARNVQKRYELGPDWRGTTPWRTADTSQKDEINLLSGPHKTRQRKLEALKFSRDAAITMGLASAGAQFLGGGSDDDLIGP